MSSIVPTNAVPFTSFNFSGSSRYVSDEQLANAKSPIDSRREPDSNEIFESRTHSANALSPMLMTEAGIFISLRDVHVENALSPMLFTPEGRLIERSSVSALKALLPIAATLFPFMYSGIEMYLRRPM